MKASLWNSITSTGSAATAEFLAPAIRVSIADLTQTSLLGAALTTLRGRSVLIVTREQLPTALALVELDGIARRMVLCTPDLSDEQLAFVASAAAADAIVLQAEPEGCGAGAGLGLPRFTLSPRAIRTPADRSAVEQTEWILLTSGTTGSPKLVRHTLKTLRGAWAPTAATADRRTVWSTFYDIRRYGGLQIYLRAVLGGCPLMLSSSEETSPDFFARAAAAQVSHLSGTPSHWRRALMSGEARRLSPRYVRLSGEVADQPLLDSLRKVYPAAKIAHAFASTEAGLAFEVNDGLAGFPADFLGRHDSVDMKVEGGTLRVRSDRNALGYLSGEPCAIADGEGYVDTGDRIELTDGRYHFKGRNGGVINVGGLKVYPEEVESVLNADPRVRVSRVRAKSNPITGAIVAADVVLMDADSGPSTASAVKDALLEACRRSLAPHKVPGLLRFVPTLQLNAAGKLVRPTH